DLTGYLPDDEPTLQLWRKIDQEFQIGSTIVIYVEADDIRDPYVLKEMDRVSTKINKYNLDKGSKDGIFSVTSIASLIKDENAKPNLPGGLGGTGKYEIPDDINLISRYIARIQSMKGVLFTDTYKVAVIILQLAENANYDQVLKNVKDVISREAHYSDMTITGTIAMQHAIQDRNLQYLKIVFPISIIFISLVLFFFHRTIKGIVIVFLPLAYALVLTFGILGILQPELTILSIAIVALLMGLGVDYSIHLLNRFAEEHSVENKIIRVEKTLKLTGKAVLLSSVTTIIGFGSLMVSTMPPIVTFGFGCAIGILLCFISASILVPCLALTLGFENNGEIHVWKIWKKFSSFVIENRKRFFAIACFFAILSLIVLPQIKTDVNYAKMAPRDLPEVQKLLEYSENFGRGTNFNALLIETEKQGLTYPEVIEAIYDMEQEMRKTGATVYSIADEIKKINDILDRSKIIEKLSDIVGIDQIIFDKVAKKGIVDEDFSKTIVLVSFPAGKSIEETESMVNKINHIASTTILPHNGQVSRLTGQDAVNVAINRQLMKQQTRSIIIALLLVLAVLIVIFNSSLHGFLTMIPVIFVLIWEPGFLVVLNIPLSVVTISIASIMIGIGIDYGIHITQRIREGIDEGLSKIDSTKNAIEKTGLSLVEAASTTTAGLLSIYFVDIPSIQQFGLVVILMTIFSLIAAVLILPIFYSIKPKK
ncbi:MAG: hypothetical protein DRN08_02985, partial [Thermoplasmata archaeon]